MSSMAKIFVVVNLILGVAAFGSAATLLGAKEDYKAANAELVKKFNEYKLAKEGEIGRLNTELASQKSRASTAVADKTNAEAQSEDYKRQLAETQNTAQKQQATIEQLTNVNKGLQQTNATFTTTVGEYAAQAKAATQDKLNMQNKWQQEVNNRVRLEAEVAKAAEEMSDVSARLGDAEKELRSVKFWVNKYRERFGDITPGPQGASGVVKGVRGALVQISVGSKDGVRVGDTYQIRRGSTYVGQIVISKVFKDQAVGNFDTEFTGPGAPPQRGDVAEPRAW